MIFEDFKKLDNINLKLVLNNLELDDIKNNISYFIQLFNNSIGIDIINYIEIIRYLIKDNLLEKEKIKMININKKFKYFMDNEFVYSELKSLNISCNKYLYNNNISKLNNKKYIDSILNAIQNTTNSKRIHFYINKLLIYLKKYNNNNYNFPQIIQIIENIIYNDKNENNFNIESLLFLVNKCKKLSNEKKNEIENILLKIDNKIDKYIYFLNNIYFDKDTILPFVLKLGYENEDIKEIDYLNLKRGFIKGLRKNNKNYILKYQPNKSFIELVMNCYLKSINLNDHFLIPELMFINNDNSYFYIIEKYKTDLYKYFNILDKNNQILELESIIRIIQFLLNAIELLHKNNIIHADLKLENIVINLDENNKIIDLKIIDFDVSLFNIVPDYLLNIDQKYIKILNNKKLRGTRIYMLKDKMMSFNNDIYSLGVIILILLYKNLKLHLILKKKKLNIELEKDKKQIINYINLIKKLNELKEKVEEDKIKLELLNFIYKIYIKDITDDNKKKLKWIKEFIINCIIHKNKKYNKNLFIDC